MSSPETSIEICKKFRKDYKKQPKNRQAALAIMEDVSDRRGIKHEFNACDNEVKKDILDCWSEIIALVFADNA